MPDYCFFQKGPNLIAIESANTDAAASAHLSGV
ncbi:Uncharacterised protein [Enterobacter asburiae]|uniref:Uncharacterized protein n=1 Tax=Enterobacter asburiae TaxID=61645 RepID=A0A376F7P4_ENTAS|nr:Uncharacterised protein [Enterobacter asburiae]